MEFEKLPPYGVAKKGFTYEDWKTGNINYRVDIWYEFTANDIVLIREESKRIVKQRADEEYDKMVKSFYDRVQNSHSLEGVLQHQWAYYQKMIEYPFTAKDVNASTGYVRGKEHDDYPSWEELERLRQYYWQYVEGDVQFNFNDYPILKDGKWYTLKANAIAIRRYFDYLQQQIETSTKNGTLPKNELALANAPKASISNRERILILCYEGQHVVQKGERDYNDYITFATPTKRKSYPNGSQSKAKSLIRSIERILPQLSEKATQQANSELNTLRANI